jgi:hypothetical protein
MLRTWEWIWLGFNAFVFITFLILYAFKPRWGRFGWAYAWLFCYSLGPQMWATNYVCINYQHEWSL